MQAISVVTVHSLTVFMWIEVMPNWRAAPGDWWWGFKSCLARLCVSWAVKHLWDVDLSNGVLEDGTCGGQILAASLLRWVSHDAVGGSCIKLYSFLMLARHAEDCLFMLQSEVSGYAVTATDPVSVTCGFQCPVSLEASPQAPSGLPDLRCAECRCCDTAQTETVKRGG